MPIENKKQWCKLLRKAKKGEPEAQFEVASYYADGLCNKAGETVVPKKLKQAFHWYLLSAKQGNESAQVAVGNALSTGVGTERDFEKAIRWTKKAIKQGAAHAAYNLGTIYRDLQKPKLAFKWYCRSAKMGDNDALLEVAFCQLFGFGTKQNPKEAYKIFTRILEFNFPKEICENTNEEAQYWLGILHLLGIGSVKRSVKKARKYLEAANKDGDHKQANNVLNLIGKTEYIKT